MNVFAIETNAKSSVLIETSSKTVLSEQEKVTELAPVSMTKMMIILKSVFIASANDVAVTVKQ